MYYNPFVKKLLIFVIATVLLLGLLFFFFKPKPTANNQKVSRPKTDTVILVVTNRKLVNGPETIRATENDTVTIKITVDEDEELHLHGYDKSIDLEKDKQRTLSFKADMTGRFPYELEKHKIDLGNLEVLPK